MTLQAGLWENPTPVDDWQIADYYDETPHFVDISSNDWTSIRFEYSHDPGVDGWTAVPGTPVLVGGTFYELNWTTPSVFEDYFVRFAFSSDDLTGVQGDLNGDLAAHIHFVPSNIAPASSPWSLVIVGLLTLMAGAVFINRRIARAVA